MGTNHSNRVSYDPFSASLPDDTVLVWFDSGFHRPHGEQKVVIVAYDAKALVPDRPWVEPFPGAQIGHATELGLSFGSFQFDSTLVIPSGIPTPELLAKLEAEFFDLCAAWSGLNYVRLNRHRGPVVMMGDGTSAIDFMRGETGLKLSDYGIESSAMKQIIEDLAKEFQNVTWEWVRKGSNRAIEVLQRRLKRFLKDRKPGRIVSP